MILTPDIFIRNNLRMRTIIKLTESNIYNAVNNCIDKILYENYWKSNKKNVSTPNLLSRNKSTRASQDTDTTNITINLKNAKDNLKKLSRMYKGVSNPHGFISDLKIALGLKVGEGASSYGNNFLNFATGQRSFSIRISNHNTNCDTYTGRASDFNLSIIISKREKKDKFYPKGNVVLDEYVYNGMKLNKLENPLSDIIDGIIDYLEKGVYTDKTQLGKLNVSPLNRHETNQDIVNSFDAKKPNGKSDIEEIINKEISRLLSESHKIKPHYV